jgi:hypothetical protein
VLHRFWIDPCLASPGERAVKPSAAPKTNPCSDDDQFSCTAIIMVAFGKILAKIFQGSTITGKSTATGALILNFLSLLVMAAPKSPILNIYYTVHE